jgi:hypothetical protein
MTDGFNGKPFEFNPKCLVISGSLAFGYYYLPHKSDTIFWIIFFGIYVALAWYDAYDMCQYKLSAETLLHPVTSAIKPPVRDGRYQLDE